MVKRFRHSSRRVFASPRSNLTTRQAPPNPNRQGSKSDPTAQSAFPKSGPPDLSQYGEFWNAFNLEAGREDAEVIKGYGGDFDTLLIFAGLFSATNTAFIVESYKDLKEDASEMTNSLLRTIIRNLHTSSFNESELITSIKPPPRAIRVNTFFFMSLSCSLFAAFGAVIGKQWLNHYEREGHLRSPSAKGMERQRKYMGLEQWKFLAVVETLPTLLQFSLFFFFVGLIDFLWPLNKVVVSVVIVMSVATISFWVVTLIIGIYNPDSPFQTRLTALLRKHLIHPIQNPENDKKEKKEEILMAHCVDWLKERTTTSNVIGVVARAVVLLTDEAKKTINLDHGGAMLAYLLRSSMYNGRVYLGISPDGLQSSLIVLRDLVLKWDSITDLVHSQDIANVSFLQVLSRELRSILMGSNRMDEMSSTVALDILYNICPPNKEDDFSHAAMLASLLRSSMDSGRVQLGISPEGLHSSLPLLRNLVMGWDSSTDLVHHQDDANIAFLPALSQALWNIVKRSNALDEVSNTVAFEILNKLGPLKYDDDLDCGAMLARVLRSSAEGGHIYLGISPEELQSSLILLRNLVMGWDVNIGTSPVHPQDTANSAFLQALSRALWRIIRRPNAMDEADEADEASTGVVFDILNKLGLVDYGDELEYGAMLAIVLGSTFENENVYLRISPKGLQSWLILLRNLVIKWDSSNDLVHHQDIGNTAFLEALSQALWIILKMSHTMDEASTTVALDILNKLGPLNYGDDLEPGTMLASVLRSSVKNGHVHLGISQEGLQSSLILLRNLVKGWKSSMDLVHPQDEANMSFLHALSQALWGILTKTDAMDEVSTMVAFDVLNKLGPLDYGSHLEYGAILALVLKSSIANRRVYFGISSEGLLSLLILVRNLIMGWDSATDFVHPQDNANTAFLQALSQKLWNILKGTNTMDEVSITVTLEILYKLGPPEHLEHGTMLAHLLRPSMERGHICFGISSEGLRSSLFLLRKLVMGWDSSTDLVYPHDVVNTSFSRTLSQTLWNILTKTSAIDEALNSAIMDILNKFYQPEDGTHASYIVESFGSKTSDRSGQLVRLSLLHDSVRSHNHLGVGAYIPNNSHIAKILAITMWNLEREPDLDHRRVALRLSWFLGDVDTMYPHVQALSFSRYLSLWRDNFEPSPLSLDSAALTTLYLRSLISLLLRDQEKWANELDREDHLSHLQSIQQDASLWSIKFLCCICFLLMADVGGRSEDKDAAPNAYYSEEWVEMVLHQLNSDEMPWTSVPCEIFYRPNDLMLIIKAIYYYLQTAQRHGMVTPENRLETFDVFQYPDNRIDTEGWSDDMKVAWDRIVQPLLDELKEQQNDNGSESAAAPSLIVSGERELTLEEEFLVSGLEGIRVGERHATPSDASRLLQSLDNGAFNNNLQPLALDVLSTVLLALPSSDLYRIIGNHSSSTRIPNMLLSTLWKIGVDPRWLNTELRQQIVDRSISRLELRRTWLQYSSRMVHRSFEGACFSSYLHSWHVVNPGLSGSYLHVVFMLLSRFPNIWLSRLEQDGHVRSIALLVQAPSTEVDPLKARAIQWIALKLFLTMWNLRIEATTSRCSNAKDLYLTPMSREAISSFLSSVNSQSRINNLDAVSRAQEMLSHTMDTTEFIKSGSTYLQAMATKQTIDAAVIEGFEICADPGLCGARIDKESSEKLDRSDEIAVWMEKVARLRNKA